MKKTFYALLILMAAMCWACGAAWADDVAVALDNRWVNMEDGARYMLDVTVKSQVTVDLFVSASGDAALADQDGKTVVRSAVYPGTAAYPGTAVLSAYLEPGRYELSYHMTSTGVSWLPARVRARSRALQVEDTGDNATLEGAYGIAEGRRYRILADRHRQYDYYRLESAPTAPKWYIIDAEATCRSVYFDVLGGDGAALYQAVAEVAGHIGMSVSTRVPVYFPAGARYLRVSAGSAFSTCMYSFCLENPPVPRKLSLPKTLRLAPGFGGQLLPTATPSSGVLSDLAWKSAKPSVATVDASGQVRALSKGTTNITVQCGKAKAVCKVTVAANEYIRKKPGKVLTGKSVYAITRRIAYQGDKIIAEVYLANRTGKTVTGAGWLTVDIVDRDDHPYGHVRFTDYAFPTPLKNGSIQVLKVEIPRQDAAELFLPSGDYRASVNASDIDIFNQYGWREAGL